MKVWLIIAAVLIVLGLALFTGIMSANHWNFKALSTTQYETNVTQIDQDFQSINLEIKTAHFRFLPSADGIARVECYEETTAKHTVTVENGTLCIRAENAKKWYEHIGVNFDTTKITLYLPKSEYDALFVKGSTGDGTIPEAFSFESMDISLSTGYVTCLASTLGKMKIRTSTGSIRVDKVRAGSLDLSTTTGRIAAREVICDGDIRVHVSTGKAVLTDVSCQSLTSDGNTGDLILRRVIASGDFSIERSTGDVTLEACDAATLSITTDTGDVTGTLLSEKVFIAGTDTGRVSVPKTTAGGKCEITTDTGDIQIDLVK